MIGLFLGGKNLPLVILKKIKKKKKNIEIDYAYINKDATKKVRLFRGDSDQDRPNIK